MVRMPHDLKLWIERQSRRNGSSQNSEVIRAIRERMERVEAARTAGEAHETTIRTSLPPEVTARLLEEAEREGRSLESYVSVRLAQSLNRPKQ